MATGQNTFWIIVNEPEADSVALTDPKDARRSMQFRQASFAHAWATKEKLTNYLVVEVRQ
jgi:hypothetical protein